MWVALKGVERAHIQRKATNDCYLHPPQHTWATGHVLYRVASTVALEGCIWPSSLGVAIHHSKHSQMVCIFPTMLGTYGLLVVLH